MRRGQILFVLACVVTLAASAAEAQTASMLSVQGLLKQGDQPVPTNIDIQFRIWNVAAGGTVPANLVDMDGNGVIEDVVGKDAKEVVNVSVSPEGIFATKLGPVSPRAFDGNARYLEIRVRPTGVGAFSTLSRTEMATAPATSEQLNSPNSGASAIVTDANGSVGIGTTAPSAKLHVSGSESSPHGFAASIGLTNGASGGGNAWRIRAGATGTQTPAGGLSIADNLDYRVSITNTGNVGIGTLGPATRLSVGGGALSIASALTSASSRPVLSAIPIAGEIRGFSSIGLTNDDGLLRLSSGGGTNVALQSFIDLTGYSTVPDMNSSIVLGTSGAERMRITSAGNVGIGITNPTAALHVRGIAVNFDLSPNGGGQLFLANNAGDNQIYLEGLNAAGNASATSLNLTGYLSQPLPNLSLITTTAYISGNLGIGTSAPATRLQVAGGTDATPAGGGFLVVGSVNSTNIVLDDNEILARNNGAATTLFLSVSGTGGVSIGTTSSPPAGSLLRVNGLVCSTGSTCASDARLKKNVRTVASALDNILRLRGVTFEWIDPAAHGNARGPQTGLIAQDVERVFPTWISKDEKGLLYLSTNGFPAVAIEAIRELKSENDALKAQVSRLDRQLADMNARLEKIGK